METVIGNIARAARKLASAGVESFVVTADHGHQFALRKEEDMRIDAPGGDTVELHRRCWIGRGGATPPGTIRVSAAELGYDSDLDFVFPTGLGVFKAGGDLAYHHGGISLQEMVVPVVTFRIPARLGAGGAAASVVHLEDVPDDAHEPHLQRPPDARSADRGADGRARRPALGGRAGRTGGDGRRRRARPRHRRRDACSPARKLAWG